MSESDEQYPVKIGEVGHVEVVVDNSEMISLHHLGVTECKPFDLFWWQLPAIASLLRIAYRHCKAAEEEIERGYEQDLDEQD